MAHFHIKERKPLIKELRYPFHFQQQLHPSYLYYYQIQQILNPHMMLLYSQLRLLLLCLQYFKLYLPLQQLHDLLTLSNYLTFHLLLLSDFKCLQHSNLSLKHLCTELQYLFKLKSLMSLNFTRLLLQLSKLYLLLLYLIHQQLNLFIQLLKVNLLLLSNLYVQ